MDRNLDADVRSSGHQHTRARSRNREICEIFVQHFLSQKDCEIFRRDQKYDDRRFRNVFCSLKNLIVRSD